MSFEERERWLPGFSPHLEVWSNYDTNTEPWRVFNQRAASEIRKRAVKGDILGLTMGGAHKPIADALGGSWPARARLAAVTLCAERKDAETETVAFRLLTDCRRVFKDLNAGRLKTQTLLENLLSTGWDDIDGRSLDARLLAEQLRGFGIQPSKLRFGRVVLQGYESRQFENAWRLVADVVDVPEEVTQ